MKKYFILLFFFSCAEIFSQQEQLSLDKAIEIALKNNYSILIAKNNDVITKNDLSYGNAGFLPQVNLNAAENLANNATKQKYSTGQEVNKSGVKSNNISSNVSLNWTLFDGMKMFAAYDKLKELSAMGDLNLKLQIEKTVSDVITSYFDVVRQKQLLRSIKEAIAIYEERVKIAETRFNIGSSSKTELLQAKVDMNAERSLLIKQQTGIYQSKLNLNYLLSRPSETDFDASDSVKISYQPVLEQLKTSSAKQNYSLLLAEKSIAVSNYSLKEIQSQRYPKITLVPSYVFTKAENQAGFVLLNQNLGFNAGITATLPLFSGFNINRQVKNAKLAIQNSTLQYNDSKNQLEIQLLKAYRDFNDNTTILNMEEENLKLAKENVTIALERFKVGTSNSLELKEAQRSYEDAQTRLVTARYNTKLSETALMRLNGELVK